VKIVRPQETSNRNLTFGSVVMAATKMLTNFLQSKKLKFFFFMFVRYWPKYFFNQYHRANWNIAGLTFKTNTSVEIITKRFSCRISTHTWTRFRTVHFSWFFIRAFIVRKRGARLRLVLISTTKAFVSSEKIRLWFMHKIMNTDCHRVRSAVD
jgi:hypothetical protein